MRATISTRTAARWQVPDCSLQVTDNMQLVLRGRWQVAGCRCITAISCPGQRRAASLPGERGDVRKSRRWRTVIIIN